MTSKPAITEEQLREMFDRNFERLRLENGHSLSPDVREAAWEQVRFYWRKLRSIAESVTDTEVKLCLPNQHTKKDRAFCIEGVVDIVREAEKVTMYDLKAHDLDFVKGNIDFYRGQINVYAYIWQQLRGERLDEAAIIATPIPEALSAAIRSGGQAAIDAALAQWDPVVPIPFDAENVQKTVMEFADVVDQIEDSEFHPATVSQLAVREGNGGAFATRVCRNCDVRFSCSSYRDYARTNKDRGWSKFADFYDLDAVEAEALDRFAAVDSDSLEALGE